MHLKRLPRIMLILFVCIFVTNEHKLSILTAIDVCDCVYVWYGCSVCSQQLASVIFCCTMDDQLDEHLTAAAGLFAEKLSNAAYRLKIF